MLKKSGDDVTFIFDGESSDTVFLVGDFNNWDKTANKLSKVQGKWQTKLSLKPGKYAYKYFVNNSWINDSSADEYITNPFGQQDSVLNIKKCKNCGEKAEKPSVKTVAAKAKTATKTASKAKAETSVKAKKTVKKSK